MNSRSFIESAIERIWRLGHAHANIANTSAISMTVDVPFISAVIRTRIGSDLCLFLIDHQIAVRAAVVAEEPPEGHGDLAVGEALALTPDAVFGNAPALFLRQRGHDGNHQLALAVEDPDILLFEAHLHAQPLQAAHRFQRVDGVACKAREAFGENQVNFIRLFDTM